MIDKEFCGGKYWLGLRLLANNSMENFKIENKTKLN